MTDRLFCRLLRHDHLVALTKQLSAKQSPIRRFMEREFPAAVVVCKEANASVRAGRKGDCPVAPVPGTDAALVGTAVEFVLPIPHQTVREPHIAGASTLALAEGRMAASELAVGELRRIGDSGDVLADAWLGRAADCAFVCARLEQRFRMGDVRARDLSLPDPATGVAGGLDGTIRASEAGAESRLDLIALLSACLADTADVYSASALYIDPVFALSLAVGGADADVIADGCLIDFKAGKGRSLISAAEIYQLVGYVLLDLDDRYDIRTVGIHALRWRTRWTIELAALLLRLSGTSRTLREWRTMFADVVQSDNHQLTVTRKQGATERSGPEAIRG